MRGGARLAAPFTSTPLAAGTCQDASSRSWQKDTKLLLLS